MSMSVAMSENMKRKTVQAPALTVAASKKQTQIVDMISAPFHLARPLLLHVPENPNTNRAVL